MEYQYCDESLICKYISPTTWASFCRFGDRNRASDSMILRWIRNDGEPLDVQAMWLESDSGREFRPEQFAQFMVEYDHGCNEFPYHKQTGELKALFKELTGFNWTYHVHAWLDKLHTQSVYIEPALIKDLPF